MKKATAITCVSLDIGGVLLTDGWDHHARKRFLGIELEEKQNRANADVISATAQVPVRVIRTDEEWMIANTVYRIV